MRRLQFRPSPRFFKRYNSGECGGWRLLPTHGMQIGAYNILVGRPTERHNPGRSRCRRIYLKHLGCSARTGFTRLRMGGKMGYFNHDNETSRSIICVKFSHWPRNCQIVREDFTPYLWLVNMQNIVFWTSLCNVWILEKERTISQNNSLDSTLLSTLLFNWLTVAVTIKYCGTTIALAIICCKIHCWYQ